jgi:GntR family transcriptional regulator, arabinose operon transcriptional repressor
MASIDKQSSISIYQQLAAIIRKQVLYAELKPGDKLPSEHEMVHQYQISRSSVRQAIDILVTEGLVERVHGKGNFIQNWRTSNPEGGTIGLLVPYERLSLFPNIISGIESAAKARGYTLILSYMGKDDREEIQTVRRLRDQRVAGLVIYPRNYITYDEMVWQLFEEGFPFVLIDRYFTELPCSYVGVDNVTAVYRAVEYLIQLGHRQIGFVTTPDPNTTSVKERFAGYRNALRHHGIDFDEKWLCRSPSISYSPIKTDENEEMEVQPFREFFHQKDHPTALIALNDYTAYLVYNAAKAEGVRIPEDMALMGFDNDEFARFNEVPLTTTEQPFREIGARAANLLIDKIRGIHSGMERVLLPTRLVQRQSCGELLKKEYQAALGGLSGKEV